MWMEELQSSNHLEAPWGLTLPCCYHVALAIFLSQRRSHCDQQIYLDKLSLRCSDFIFQSNFFLDIKVFSNVFLWSNTPIKLFLICSSDAFFCCIWKNYSSETFGKRGHWTTTIDIHNHSTEQTILTPANGCWSSQRLSFVQILMLWKGKLVTDPTILLWRLQRQWPAACRCM